MSLLGESPNLICYCTLAQGVIYGFATVNILGKDTTCKKAVTPLPQAILSFSDLIKDTPILSPLIKINERHSFSETLLTTVAGRGNVAVYTGYTHQHSYKVEVWCNLLIK